MKYTFNSFVLIDFQKNDIKNSFETILKEMFESLDIKINLKSSELTTLIIDCDINNDIRESMISLVQDFDGNVFVLEGFRIENEKEIEPFKKAFKNNHFKNYMRVADLLLKCNDIELKQMNKVIASKVEKDDYMKEIIFSMFNNNLNVTKTASNVYMHRNSITNKLDIIEKETGINMQVFNEAVAMYNVLKR